MKVNKNGHVYDCLPPYFDNRILPEDEQFIVGLKAVGIGAIKALHKDIASIYSDYAIDEAHKLKEERTEELIKSKFVYVKGVEIDGHEGEIDYETLCKTDELAEIVSWISRVVMSGEELTKAERKNFLPVLPSASE